MRRLLSTNRIRWSVLATALTFGVSLAAASGAQAVVVNDAGTQAGVALVPSTRGNALPGGVSAVASGRPCTDPWLSSDLGGPSMPSVGLCYQGGGVIHKNETFALTWDQQYHTYWSQTRGYVEQFLRDVADGSGSLNSPFAVTTQYNDGGGRAQNASVFGGGCIDYGQGGGSQCEFGSPTGTGHDYPANGCTPQGDSFVDVGTVGLNSVCLTDGQLQSEVSTMVAQTGIIGRTQPGYTPLVTLLLPAGVETCLDSAHTLCSSNSNLTPPPPSVSTLASGGNIAAGTYGVEITYTGSHGESAASSAQTVTTTGGSSTITIDSPPTPPVSSGVTGWYAYVTQPNGSVYMRQGGSNSLGTPLTLTSPPAFAVTPPNNTAYCSYHAHVNVGGTDVAYLVQPWTAGTGCDEPGLPNIPQDPTPPELSVAVGARLVSPLSQSQIAALVNPALNGWTGSTGGEIDDNGVCTPYPKSLDSVSVGHSAQNPYFLQREFNNAAALEFDPFTYGGCAPVVDLLPAFVAPSAVNAGDEVQLDGSATASTLIVPNAGYQWNFGDGTTGTGPSVVHSYANGGTYQVALTVTDRGGNASTLTQPIQVLGANGQPVPTSGGGSGAPGGFSVRLALSPQSLKNALNYGIKVRLTSNLAADGIARVYIPRGAATRAHISSGRAPSVQIGIGTVHVTSGTGTLRVHLSRGTAGKLRKLGHVTLTIRLSLVAKGGRHVTIVEAGRY